MNRSWGAVDSIRSSVRAREGRPPFYSSDGADVGIAGRLRRRSAGDDKSENRWNENTVR